MKKLFVFVSNGGDGSSYPQYTFDESYVNKLQEQYDNGESDWDSLGCDGDGFHYDTLMVPDECTPESMGFRDLAKQD